MTDITTDTIILRIKNPTGNIHQLLLRKDSTEIKLVFDDKLLPVNFATDFDGLDL